MFPDKTKYLDLLREYGIPVPDLLYPFAWHRRLEDFGPLGLNLNIISGKDIGSGTDRYNFYEHVSFFGSEIKTKNRRMYNDDMSSLTTQFDTNAAFTIIANLYYGNTLDRSNGTIFMFSEGVRKFRVQESRSGFVIR